MHKENTDIVLLYLHQICICNKKSQWCNKLKMCIYIISNVKHSYRIILLIELSIIYADLNKKSDLKYLIYFKIALKTYYVTLRFRDEKWPGHVLEMFFEIHLWAFSCNYIILLYLCCVIHKKCTLFLLQERLHLAILSERRSYAVLWNVVIILF